MTFKNRTNLVIFGLVVCFLIGLGIGISVDDSAEFSFVRAEDRGGQAADARADTTTLPVSVNPALLAMRERGWSFSGVAPAVVNISSIRIVQEQVSRGPFFSDPFFDFFGRRFYSVPRERRERSLGSGVIVSPDGIVITNNHVVEEAAEVQVYLADGREIDAKLVGTDPATDLAVLKIDGHDFPTIPFGNSDSADIGDVVLALGNPFGLGQTVTMGIISAKGRANVGLVDYEDFIQTDAAINPGNSGGALVDITGKLIGVNTAIYSRTGGYQGIGFAIPANMVRTVMTSINDRGRFVRGWAGISFQDLDSDMAHAFEATGMQGALVNDVAENGPGESAGLIRGDIITTFDGQPVTSAVRLNYLIALTPVGKKVDVEYWRFGHKGKTQLTIGEAPTEFTYLSKSSDEWVSQIEGVVVENLSATTARQQGLKKGAKGVVVKNILARSPAAYSGLREGDIILEIDNTPIEDVEQFKTAVRKKEGRKMVLLIVRRGALYYLSL